MARRSSKFDIWRKFQSEPGQCDMGRRSSKFDFWFQFQEEPGQRDMARRSSKFDFPPQFRRQEFGRVQCGVAYDASDVGDRRDAADVLTKKRLGHGIVLYACSCCPKPHPITGSMQRFGIYKFFTYPWIYF